MTALDHLKTDRSLGIVQALELLLEAEDKEKKGMVHSDRSVEVDVARLVQLEDFRRAVKQCLAEYQAAVRQAEHNLAAYWAETANPHKNRIASAVMTRDWSGVMP